MPDKRRTWIKFCGLGGADDVEPAIAAGADAVGIILAPSPRRVTLGDAAAIARAVPASVELFAVVVDPEEADVSELRALGAQPQFHGDEGPEFCEATASGPYLKAFHVPAGTAPDEAAVDALAARYPRATLLVDSTAGGLRGGTGLPFRWETLRGVASRRRIVVSGGLTPENVGDLVRSVRPFGVDVRSGIETGGRKDVEKMHAFVRAVREADAQA